MDQKGKRPVRKENPVREWISDNLRYIMLIAVIAVIVIAVIFGIRAIAGHGGGEEDRQTVQSSSPETGEDSSASSTPEPTETATPTPTATPEPTETATPTPTATPEPTETATPTPTATPEPTQTAGLTQDNQEVQSLIAAYYSALTDRNPDALTGIVDELTEEDRAVVANNQLIESYSNVQTYTYPGEQDGTYVVFASYDYKYINYEEQLPALTQFYVYRNESGSLCMASEISDSSVQSYIQQVLGRTDVQTLIGQVQAEYDAVLSSNSELQAYVESLSG